MTSNNCKPSEVNMEDVCNLLDKLTIKQLELMEAKMENELYIETNINNGCIEFAKARYILGQSAVSSTCLPTESSVQFSATKLCQDLEDNDVKQIKLVNNDAEDTVNPMKWFGVLVPHNLHKAQKLFINTIDYVVDCVNVQLQLLSNSKSISILKHYKQSAVKSG